MSALFYTPGEMYASATALDGDMRRLSIDVESSGVSDSFKAQWRDFHNEWKAFYEGLGGVGGYIDRLWGGTQDEIDQYRGRLVSWQDNYRAQGGKRSGAGAALPPPPFNPLGDVKWIVLGVAGIAALVFFGPAIGIGRR